eukprot:gene17791-19568_t
MDYDYFICGFNGFEQFSGLTNKQEDAQEEGLGHISSDVDEDFEHTDKEHAHIGYSKNNFLSPQKLALHVAEFLLSWSALYFVNEEGRLTKLNAIMRGEQGRQGIENDHRKFCDWQVDGDENFKVKVEYPDCPRGFAFLPLQKLNNACNFTDFSKVFLLTEDEKVFKIVSDDATDQKSIQDREKDQCHKARLRLSKFSISDEVEIRSVSCGKEHTLALSNSGRVYSFGLGSRGQLGTGSVENCEKPCPVDALGMVNIVMVVAGGWHSMALSGDGDLYSWGWNESGQLGIGCPDPESAENNAFDCTEKNLCKRPMFSFLPLLVHFELDVVIHSVSCGHRHSAAVSNNGMFTWGWNAYGQLGHGDKTNRHRPIMIHHNFSCTNMNNIEVLCNAWNTLICHLSKVKSE